MTDLELFDPKAFVDALVEVSRFIKKSGNFSPA